MYKSAATTAAHTCSSPMVGCFRTKFPVFVTVVVQHFASSPRRKQRQGRGRMPWHKFCLMGRCRPLQSAGSQGRRDFFPKLSALCVSHFVQFLHSYKSAPRNRQRGSDILSCSQSFWFHLPFTSFPRAQYKVCFV